MTAIAIHKSTLISDDSVLSQLSFLQGFLIRQCERHYSEAILNYSANVKLHMVVRNSNSMLPPVSSGLGIVPDKFGKQFARLKFNPQTARHSAIPRPNRSSRTQNSRNLMYELLAHRKC